MPNTSGPRWLRGVGSQISKTEALTDRLLESSILPAWQRATSGEPRWPVSVAIVAALAMQITLPAQVQLQHAWILPTIGALLLLAATVRSPSQISEVSTSMRVVNMVLIGSITTANIVSASRLIAHLLDHSLSGGPTTLLRTGGAIWLTNVITFALWYWELDRGGPAARTRGSTTKIDFLFVQMSNPEFAPEDWKPGFVDYLYLAFTNAAAFGPADVMPLTRWTKLTMMLQSIISLVTIALVISRAVGQI